MCDMKSCEHMNEHMKSCEHMNEHMKSCEALRRCDSHAKKTFKKTMCIKKKVGSAAITRDSGSRTPLRRRRIFISLSKGSKSALEKRSGGGSGAVGRGRRGVVFNRVCSVCGEEEGLLSINK